MSPQERTRIIRFKGKDKEVEVYVNDGKGLVRCTTMVLDRMDIIKAVEEYLNNNIFKKEVSVTSVMPTTKMDNPPKYKVFMTHAKPEDGPPPNNYEDRP